MHNEMTNDDIIILTYNVYNMIFYSSFAQKLFGYNFLAYHIILRNACQKKRIITFMGYLLILL